MPRQPGVWERKKPDGSFYAFYTTIDGEQHKLEATTRKKAEDELNNSKVTLEHKAIGPLEMALSLAPDDAYRAKVYRALVPAYRTLPGWEKMAEACGMSEGRTDLASFQMPVFLSRYLLGWSVIERKNLGPVLVWTSLSQTATATPPWNGPHFFSGWRGALVVRFGFVAVGGLLRRR